MGSSIPGNSCRTNTRCCAPTTGAGCMLTLPGTCVYYSGTHITLPGINTGDNLNIVVNKLVQYIDAQVSGATVVPVISADFDLDGVTYSSPALAGVEFELFWNDINRFIFNTTEWDYVPTGGFEILIPGFDASTTDYHFYLFPR